jgi:hypothetical protein
MPLAHVVTFTFKPNTPLGAITELACALDGLSSDTAALSYHHGADLKLRPDNADYSVSAIFEDEAALSVYLSSARHQQIVRDLVGPHLRSRSAVQFAITPQSGARDGEAPR